MIFQGNLDDDRPAMFLRPDQANPTCQRSLRRQPRHPLYLQPWRGRNIVFSWNIKTLFSKWLNNFSQGAIATTMTQPLDVLKTRSMNAKPGFFLSRLHFKFISAGSVCLYLNFLFLTFSISQESSPAQ